MNDSPLFKNNKKQPTNQPKTLLWLSRALWKNSEIFRTTWMALHNAIPPSLGTVPLSFVKWKND